MSFGGFSLGGVLLFVSMLFGVLAVIAWWRNKQSIRKGFGFTFHWWSLADLAGGMLIATSAMVGIFVVELLVGSIRVVGTQVDMAALRTARDSFIVGAVFEELFHRALLLSGLVVVLGGRTWPAILISAVLFGAVHASNPGASYLSAFGNALGGLMYGIAFIGGKNIWLPLGLHFAWNFVQGPILGFRVSGHAVGGLVVQQNTGADLITGGAYGPEAGLVGMGFRFVVIAMVLAYLQWRCHGHGNISKLEFPITVYANPPQSAAALVLPRQAK